MRRSPRCASTPGPRPRPRAGNRLPARRTFRSATGSRSISTPSITAVRYSTRNRDTSRPRRPGPAAADRRNWPASASASERAPVGQRGGGAASARRRTVAQVVGVPQKRVQRAHRHSLPLRQQQERVVEARARAPGDPLAMGVAGGQVRRSSYGLLPATGDACATSHARAGRACAQRETVGRLRQTS